MLTPFALSGLLAGISSLLFGTIVLFKSRDPNIGRSWFLFTLFCAIWGLGVLETTTFHDQYRALWTWRLSYAFGANWIAPLFFHFVSVFAEKKIQKVVLAQYAIASVFFVMAFTPWQYSGVRWFHDSYYCVAGPLYLVSSLWWLSLVLFSHVLLLSAYRSTTRLKKIQIRFFFFAMAFGFSGGVFDFLPPLGINIYPWGNFSIFFYPLMMSYAILRYRLMDLTIIIRKTLIYSGVSGALALIYLATIAIFAPLFAGLARYQTIYSSAIAAGLVALCFQPIRKRVQAFVDRKFFRQFVDREEKLYELSREVATHPTAEAMGQALMRVINETLHPKVGALYLRRKDSRGYVRVAFLGEPTGADSAAEDDPLATYLLEHPQPFVQDEPFNVGESQSTRTANPRRKQG